MTHNIVAEFSCSIWKESETERATSLGFSVGDFKQYQVVAGSVFNEEYNETLDSATILLSQVQKEDRLSYIKPYDFVRVYDKSTYDETTQTYGFDKVYLVDNFNEKENNIEEHIFGYTINLMSETKLLEKFQCPNLAITHKINEDGSMAKLTIWEHIRRYMELYVSKTKFSEDGVNWKYEPVIKFPIEYVNVSTSSQFDASNFDGLRLELYMPLSLNVDLDFVEIQDCVVTNTPETTWASQRAFIDKQNRRIGFEGIIANFETVSNTATESFDERDFVPQADEYEIFLVVKQLGNEVRGSSVVIDNFTVNSSLIWSTQEVTYNSETRQIIFHGITDATNVGDVVVEYSCQEISGSVSIHYRWGDFEHDAFYQKFNVPCADLPFNAPTLRQLLTNLMLQVGCIPTVKNRTLSFLDFQLDAQNFGNGDYTVDHTVNFIHRALSSDSCVNTLVNMSNNVLDSENEVICETLGFRDRSNVLLKQTENLTLETRFPIYKVNKFMVNYFAKVYIRYPQLNINFDPKDYRTDVNTSKDYYMQFVSTQAVPNGFSIIYNNGKQLRIVIECNGSQIYMANAQFYPLKHNSDGSYSYCYDENEVIVRKILPLASTVVDAEHPNDYQIITSIYFPELDDDEWTDVYMLCEDVEMSYWGSDVADWHKIHFKLVNATFSVGGLSGSQRVMFMQKDITPLLVENSQRALLNTNFVQMTEEDITSLEQLSKYLYGTVGYSIGSNKIEGFSTVYNVGEATGLGWLVYDYTYIENIMNLVLQISTGNVEDYASLVDFYKVPVMNDINADLEGVVRNNVIFKTGSWWRPVNVVNYTTLFFDIYYQPLNSFNLAYVKKQESVDYLISQYDGNASGLTDFDRLSLHEQEQVDRIGNEILNISQRTINYGDIQTFDNGPLYFMDDTNRSGSVESGDNGVKYIIFKRSFSIGNNCYNASYTASKDAILKDYFTSIRTKYRAYQYVDYSSSTLRKERDTIFVRIGEDWYDGDDKIWFGQWRFNALSGTQLTNTYQFVYNFNLLKDNSQKITYVSDKGKNSKKTQETTKNDISIVTNFNTLAFIYETPDNVGNGTYISNANYSTSYKFQNGGTLNGKNYKIGGVPQSWQIWDEDTFNISHPVIFLYDIDFYNNSFFHDITDVVTSSSILAEAAANEVMKNASLSPIVQNSLVDTNSGDNLAFTVVDDNKSGVFAKTFYKDYAERINHTVEFIYYAETPNIKWTDYFIELSPFAAYKYNNNNRYDIVILASNNDDRFEVSREPYYLTVHEGETTLLIEDAIQVVSRSEEEPVSQILVNFNGYKYIKVLYHSSTYEWNDIVVFRRKDNNAQTGTFYITLNDTKSDYVMAEKNGVLYRKYKVAKNTLSRTVTDIDD